MHGALLNPKDFERQMTEVNSLVMDYLKHSTEYECHVLQKKLKAWKKMHGRVTKKLLSGFKSFVIENTKI